MAVLRMSAPERAWCDTHHTRPCKARRELLDANRVHIGFYCVDHAEDALQKQRDVEAAALLATTPKRLIPLQPYRPVTRQRNPRG